MEHESEGIDVAPGVWSAIRCEQLLRTHVPQRAHDTTAERGGRVDCSALRLRCGFVQCGLGLPCYAVVDDLRLTIGADEDVGRLEVAMHDALAVAVRHGITDLAEQADPPPNRQGPRGGEPGDRAGAIHELHHEERHPAERGRSGAAGVDVRDMGVPQAGQRLGFPQQPLMRRRRNGPLANHLHRNRPPRSVLPGFVDPAHAAGRQQADDREPPDIDTGGQFARKTPGVVPAEAEGVVGSGQAWRLAALRVRCRSGIWHRRVPAGTGRAGLRLHVSFYTGFLTWASDPLSRGPPAFRPRSPA